VGFQPKQTEKNSTSILGSTTETLKPMRY